jgi:hypothetical protein
MPGPFPCLHAFLRFLYKHDEFWQAVDKNNRARYTACARQHSFALPCGVPKPSTLKQLLSCVPVGGSFYRSARLLVLILSADEKLSLLTDTTK